MLGSASSPPSALSRQAPSRVSVASSRVHALPWLPAPRGIQVEASFCARGGGWREGQVVPQRQSRWPREKVRASALGGFPGFSIPGVPGSLCNQEKGRSLHIHGGEGAAQGGSEEGREDPLHQPRWVPEERGHMIRLGGILRQAGERGRRLAGGLEVEGLPGRGPVMGAPWGCISFFKLAGGSAPLATCLVGGAEAAGTQPKKEVCTRGAGSQLPQHLGRVPGRGGMDLGINHGLVLNTVKEEPRYSKNPVVMVDEVMSSSPPKFSFPEAGLRVMITNKFGPRTRLRMASRIIINEVRSRTRTVRAGGLGRGSGL